LTREDGLTNEKYESQAISLALFCTWFMAGEFHWDFKKWTKIFQPAENEKGLACKMRTLIVF